MSATSPGYTPTFAAVPQTTSYVTEAISQSLAAKDCPSKFRPLVDYLVGLAGGCTDWFEAGDDEVGLNARPTAEGVSRDAACKWVQRMRKGFLEWEKKANVTFIECMPGGRDPKTKENYKSRYKVNLLGLAEATVAAGVAHIKRSSILVPAWQPLLPRRLCGDAKARRRRSARIERP